ncbi:hypothetical protein OAP51_05815 [Alphaproteobacteria bacterium]|nr:hypothetical protein [Alphaproteobacteria bacterium]
MAYIGNQAATAFTSFDKQTISGDGTAVYTLSHAVANEQELEVYYQNVRQEGGAGKAFTVSGNQITFSENIPSGQTAYINFQGKAVQTVVPPDGSVGTAKIADDAVTSAKIADNAVVSASIADDAVTLAKAADSLYRTGTWTPVIVSGSGSYNGLTTSGTFTRLGNTVHVTARILITASGNASGSMNINNLPFNGFTPAGVRQMIQGRENANNGDMIQILIDSGTKLGKMQYYEGTNCTHTTNYEYIVTGTYQTNDA